MARLAAVADGNNTSASTWAVIDSTSFLESESSSTTMPTTYATTYTTFTPGAITIDGIGIKISVRIGTTGTLSVELYNNTGGASVAGTEVTINMTDVADCTSGDIDGGWYFFKFASAVTLAAATNYSVRFKTSTAAQASFFGSTATNPTRFLRTTTTQAPVAGDDRIVVGEWTGAGSMTTRTVTLDDTSVVDYGSASASVVNPALAIGIGGTVLAGTTASTTFVQKISGNVVVYNGGALRLGTSGSRMPSTSSFTWTFDCVANVDFGIDVRRKGEFSIYGEVKQRHTTLTADEAAASTVINLTSTSGWKNGDELYFTPTNNITTQGELKTISTVDSSTQVTLSAGLTNEHLGTGDLIGRVGNATCNVSIVGISLTVCTYVNFRQSSIGYLDNTSFKFLGSATANKKGLEFLHSNTSVNSVTITSCVIRDLFASASIVIGTATASVTTYTITDNLILGMSGGPTALSLSGGSAGGQNFTASNNLVSTNNTTGTGISITAITSATGVISNNYVSGWVTGVNMALTTAGAECTISDFIIHNCNTGMTAAASATKYINNVSFIRNAAGLTNTAGKIILNSCNFFSNNSYGVNINASATISYYGEFNNCVFRGGAIYTQALGLQVVSGLSNTGTTIVNNCSFGVTNQHQSFDVNVGGYTLNPLIFNNCTLASAVEVNTTAHTFIDENNYVGFINIDGTGGNNRMYIRQAIVSSDTTIFNTASPSIRITPKSATIEANTKTFTFKVPVNSGQTCTPSVYVRESVAGDGADYNGNPVKLYLKSNVNIGITTDTLIDTATGAAVGAWEELTGTTAAASNDGVMEFYLTCNGTAGWINIDDFTATVA